MWVSTSTAYTAHPYIYVVCQSVCRRCKHLRWVDVDGYICCEKGLEGKEKIYCVGYEKKEVE